MKILFYLSFLFIHSSCADDYSAIDLNSENLELMALKSSPDSIVDKYVLDLIKTKHAKEYYKIIKDSEKVALLIEKHKQEVLAATAKLSDSTNFKLEYNVNYSNYDENTSELTLKNFLIGNAIPISTEKTRDDGMPSNFILLIPNIEMMNDYKVNAKKFKAVIESRKTLRNKKLFMELIVNLAKFQNGDNFQTVIKAVNIYDSEEKNSLLATKTETSSTQDLIGDWLLSDGYTNKLIGIHSFSFFGYRLQDQLRTVSTIKHYCDKTQKIANHQVVVCNREFGENILIITTYIGGILAKIDLVAKSALSEADKKVVMQNIKMNIKKPHLNLTQNHNQWNNYETQFDFYSDAFNGTKSPESKYHYSLGTNKAIANLDLTLVISMISNETIQLIEENK